MATHAFASRRRAQPLAYLAIATLALIWLLPVLAGLLTSIRTQSEIMLNGFFSFPASPTAANYANALERAKILKYLVNSFIITIPAVLFILFLGSLSAFALAKYRFRGNLPLYLMFIAGSMLPYHILAVPIFKLSNQLGLYNTHGSVILIHVAYQVAFATFLLRNFTRSLPDEIIDAARVDGCSELRIYWQMILPLIAPALAALATLEFTWIYNDYLWALVLLSSESLRPVTAGLANLRGQYNADWPLIIAGALISSVPTIVVFFALQRYFVQGLTMGSGK